MAAPAAHSWANHGRDAGNDRDILRRAEAARHIAPKLPQILLADGGLAGLVPELAPTMAHALETKPRTPILVDEIIAKYKGNFILACEGNPPLNEDGMYCLIGGKPYLDQLKRAAKDCQAIISWGSCASWGRVQAARPNPTTSRADS